MLVLPGSDTNAGPFQCLGSGTPMKWPFGVSRLWCGLVFWPLWREKFINCYALTLFWDPLEAFHCLQEFFLLDSDSHIGLCDTLGLPWNSPNKIFSHFDSKQTCSLGLLRRFELKENCEKGPIVRCNGNQCFVPVTLNVGLRVIVRQSLCGYKCW